MARVQAVPTPSPSGVTIQNHLTGSENGSSRLLVMLPGRNYSCDAPVLFYLRQMAQTTGFDVLSTSYGFQQTGAAPDPDEMLSEVKAAVEAVMQNGYKEICVVSKSIGSTIAVQLARLLEGYNVALIILTPVPAFLAGFVASIRTLIVMGTADPVYQMPECTAARNRAEAEWVILPGLDHGFNVPSDWEASVAALPLVVRACQRFLTTM